MYRLAVNNEYDTAYLLSSDGDSLPLYCRARARQEGILCLSPKLCQESRQHLSPSKRLVQGRYATPAGNLGARRAAHRGGRRGGAAERTPETARARAGGARTAGRRPRRRRPPGPRRPPPPQGDRGRGAGFSPAMGSRKHESSSPHPHHPLCRRALPLLGREARRLSNISRPCAYSGKRPGSPSARRRPISSTVSPMAHDRARSRR